MGLSRRQKIIELLLNTDVPLSPSEIARILKIDEDNVIADLPRIAEVARRKGWKLIILPQVCKKCGFTFEPTVHVASKCPRCGSQWLQEPRFRLVK